MDDEDEQLYIYGLYGVMMPRKLRAQKTIRAKIGPSAKITEDQISKAQQFIDECKLDFKPEALNQLTKIENEIKVLRHIEYDRNQHYNAIVIPMMQIKGQAGMFGNMLVSEISAMMMRFLEIFQEFDNDALELLTVYCRTVRISYEKEIINTETDSGRAIINEMQQAMERYKAKIDQKRS